MAKGLGRGSQGSPSQCVLMIGIIDYGMGNLRSVQKAFERLGHEAAILRTPAQLDQAHKLILPGVGAYADAMLHLRERGWVQPLLKTLDAGVPTLGICLGMQLLFDGSQEDASSPDTLVPGLGVIPGSIVRFTDTQPDGSRIKVPHMGWNSLTWDAGCPLFAGLEPGAFVYFVHGYYAKPANDTAVASRTDYGQPFTSAVHHGHVWATQFHPEKSQQVGMRILENFAALPS